MRERLSPVSPRRCFLFRLETLDGKTSDPLARSLWRAKVSQVPPQDLGPLPRADGGAELQRASLAALRAALPHGEWIVRDERSDDLGVDLSLEVLVGGRGTNFRSQVQLKARSNLNANSDGSWSLPVPVANLNYLLSGPTPLYVLFRPETNELFVVSARDELRRIERSTPSWKTQQDVTLRFADHLEPAVLDRLRERIIREARANRQLQDLAVSLAPGSRIQVDAATLQPRSPTEAEQLLLDAGMLAVTHGFGNKVLDICTAVDPTRFAAHPKLLLVRGYAEFSAGRYFRADAPLREALASASKLPVEDRHFLRFLVDAVDCALGHTTNEEFRERSTQWRKGAPPVLAAQYDVLHYWMLRSEASSQEEQVLQDQALRSAIDRLAGLSNAPQSLVHYAETLRLFLDAQDWALRLVDVLAASSDQMLWHIRFREPSSVVIERELAVVAAWRARAEALMNAIASVGNVPRYCEIQFTRDLCEEMLLGYLHLVARMTDRPLPEIPEALIERVRATRAFAAQHGQLEFELRGGLVESDLEDLRGHAATARQIAQDVCDRATALRFADIARVARRTLTEGGMHSVRAREIEAIKADGFDAFFINMSEGDMAARSREACEMLGLSQERLPVVLDGLRCEVAGATARRDWCRHLRLLERAPAEESAAHLYVRPPERCCTCERFGHRSLIPSADWSALIPAFKQTCCLGCSAREPKQRLDA